ncbi:MAG: translation initiation factor IF-2 [Chloroflexi bacterium]|nr:translation initiation factor IF-2 [Dehalococcoidia bacterium]PKB84696.1 MAG: translation initiation factor IF-2 [SAR202 cluster bacterium MP-NPac-SRR3961935-G1]RUA21077.1 MAG: translation initiation factor IF-2 [Chloroflexota bacterium]
MTSDGRPTTVDETGAARKPRKTSERRAQSRALVLPETMTVQYLAEVLNQNPIDVIKQLMRNGIMASMNQVIDYQVTTLVTTALGIRTSMAEAPTAAKGPAAKTTTTEDDADLVVRPPVVTVLGHVDHGKTSLLDSIKNTKVVDGEAGGITQHIGAYQIESNGHPITFLDTPGHAAFTAIRARGARVTDIAVLVVAADDGIMPQTLEAINHAKAAEVPIVVAINKMDLPGADPERVKRQLSEQELLVEDWGGDIISVDVSAKTGAGIDNLLENLLLVAEIGELKANPNKPARGVVIEAKLDRKRGPSTTVLVQDGTLKIGDFIVAGGAYGRVKAMSNDQGKPIKSVLPGYPAEVLGFNNVPEAGDQLTVAANEREGRSMAEANGKSDTGTSGQGRALTLEEVVNQVGTDEVKELNLVIKADVQGSVEAVRGALERMVDEDATVRVLHSGSGAVTESDILLASASEAIVISFSIGAEPSAERLADRMGVEIRHYNIIYQLLDDIEKALHGMLDPVYTEIIVGRAEVREIFEGRRGTQIAGCRITEGRMVRNGDVRVVRDGAVVEDTTVSSLRHFREEVNEMNAGTECGIVLQGFNDFQEGDILEVHRQERGRR